ncbi:MAG: hypothetical protein N2645_22180 [Clostridia bacterium]|nr:hypothetical protein [Clostridia bacterium]
MFKFIKKKLTKSILNLMESGEKDHSVPPRPNENQLQSKEPKPQSLKKYDLNEKLPTKIWKKDFNPLRRIVLWGWDDSQNPSFLILYGRHPFKNNENTGREKVLQDEVVYTSYAVFKGKEGHLPSFQAVKIIEEGLYDRSRNGEFPAMFYKKGLEYSWSWRCNPQYIVKEFQNLKPENQLIFPYFVSLHYGQYIKKIEDMNMRFEGFKPARTPNEILKLDEHFDEYFGIMTDMMSNLNIYIRKKRLKEMLAKNPPKEVITTLLNVGSAEVISGLFLELARAANPILIQEAKALMESEIKWTDSNYAKGVKRCANIYIHALDPELKTDKINWIRKTLREMDLHLIRINKKDIPPEKVMDGSSYRRYALSGLLKDYYLSYDYNERRYVETEAPRRYKVGPYTDGVRLKLIDFKSTLQEAEIYELADVIGKIAYYLDAPRLTYYLKWSGKVKAYKYFHRYVKRIIHFYAENQPGKFMEVMRHLLTSYTPDDYVCKFRGNFQFNEFIKYYLYHDFAETPPTGWENWSARYEWLTNDQLMKLGGRYEYKREIWDQHLDVVADIAIRAQILPVIKACYCILKDSPNAGSFIDNMNYRQLISLTQVPYGPLAGMFKSILTTRLNQLKTFDPALMLGLMGCPDKKMHERAMEFFQRTNGAFSPEIVAELLSLDNLEQWVELFRQNLLSMGGEQYAAFIKHILSEKSGLMELHRELPESIRDILTLSLSQIRQASTAAKVETMSGLIAALFYAPKMPEWLITLIEELVFAFSVEELQSILAEVSIEPGKKSISVRNKRIISLLDSVRNRKSPSDSEILDILDNGNSKMTAMLFNLISQNKEELQNRFSTLLILFESEATVLNRMAEEIFDGLPSEKQKKMHAILIDSPVPKAYTLGLKKLDAIYGDMIPGDFIIGMLEHGAADIKAYISDKMNLVIDQLGNGNKDLFMYYLKTLLLLPNKVSISKDRICEAIPRFALKYRDKIEDIESILLDIGGSNIIKDSERALVTLAKVRGEVLSLES